METVQEQLRLLLEGRPFEELHEFCDFSLSDQYEAAAAKGVQPNTPTDFTPVVKKSVVYIVGAIIFNDRGEVLMMQEAKSSCAGQWYLPAGKMEPGEDIVEAAVREVREETGLEFEVTSLLLVESAGGCWFRFLVTGHVIGGRLKTPADADSESLQAKWVEDISKMSLRANDILPHIERGKLNFLSTTGTRPEPWHPPILPALRPHKRLLLRAVILIRKKSNNRVHVLVSEKVGAHLPICDINPARSVHSTLKKYLTFPSIMKTTSFVLALALLGVAAAQRGGRRQRPRGGRDGTGYSAPADGGYASPAASDPQPTYTDQSQYQAGAPGGDDNLAMLEKAVPGIPGEDYPIYAEAPETGFACDGQVDGGYYADPEAECQVFHICTADGQGGLAKYSFLCPNGTIFNQNYFICDWWFNFDCAEAEGLYSLNDEIAAEREANSAASNPQASYASPDSAPIGGYDAPSDVAVAAQAAYQQAARNARNGRGPSQPFNQAAVNNRRGNRRG